jgi:phosphatidylserine decarboxylase
LTKVPVAKEGLVFILPALLLTVLFWGLGFPLAGLVTFVLFLFFLFFFRNPKRTYNCKEDELVSPADGRVMGVEEMMEEGFIGQMTKRISIFMSVTDVHVNRAPCEGSIVQVRHMNGRYRLAFKSHIENENERNYLVLEGKGERFLLVQIAGFLARRIICYVKPGDRIGKGEPFGMIAFGSRVDIYMPPHYESMVKSGDKVRAGQTTLARKGGSDEKEKT